MSPHKVKTESLSNAFTFLCYQRSGYMFYKDIQHLGRNPSQAVLCPAVRGLLKNGMVQNEYLFNNSRWPGMILQLMNQINYLIKLIINTL